MKVEDLMLPGETLRSILDFNRWDMDEFLSLVELTQEDIDALISGEKPFDIEISQKLARKIKLPEEFWQNLQVNYDDEKRKILNREKLRRAQNEIDLDIDFEDEDFFDIAEELDNLGLEEYDIDEDDEES